MQLNGTKLLAQIFSKIDLLIVSVIASLIVLRFWATIFLHRSISKLYLIALWDSVFYPISSGPNQTTDPTLVQQHLPQKFFIADIWQQHAIPLWNAFSGFGMPLLADPQTFVFSPIFSLFMFFPSMRTWNVLLVLELFLGAVFTYLLCREFSMPPIASLVGAVLFTFCPYIDSQLELLGNGNCLIPFVFLFFLRVAKRRSLRSAILAGIAAAVELLSAHPEAAFVTIAFATLVMFSAAYCHDRAHFKPLFLLSLLLLAGAVAFGLAAPVLIPFTEYFLHCDSYKFTDAPKSFSLQGIFLNFAYPFYQRNNLFWGPLSWWGIIAFFWLAKRSASGRFAPSVLFCLIASICAITQLFPINLLFRLPPFSLVLLHYYVLPHYVFFVSVASALGIAFLNEHLIGYRRRSMAIITVIGLVPLTLSLMVSTLAGTEQLDSSLANLSALLIEFPRFNQSRALIIIFSSLAMLAVLILTLRTTRKFRQSTFILFLALGMADLIFISHSSLPITPAFEYPPALPFDTKSADSRFISTGNHLFKPSSYLVYQLPMLQVANPLIPKGFSEFMTACGAHISTTDQFFEPTITRLLDLTGTRTIISQRPILDEDAIDIQSPGNQSSGQNDVEYGSLLSLKNIRLLRDTTSGALFCLMTARIDKSALPGFKVDLIAKDMNGSRLLYTESQTVSAEAGTDSITCSTLLPPGPGPYTISLKVTSVPDSQPVPPLKIPFGEIRSDGSWLLATSGDLSRFKKINNDRFRLLTNHNTILSYENKTALKRYFFGRKIAWFEQRPLILDYLKTHAKELVDIVVMEQWEKKDFEKLLAKVAPNSFDSHLIELDQSGVIEKRESAVNALGSEAAQPWNKSLRIQTRKPALLVVSDLYYPGWRALLDGSDWPIFRADYLFRAVLIPSGQHIVEFKYQPWSFALGSTLFLITFSALVFALMHTFVKRQFFRVSSKT